MVKKLIALFFLTFIYGSSFSMDWMKAICYPHDALSNHSSSGHYKRRVVETFKDPEVQEFLREFQPPKEILSAFRYADTKNQPEALTKTAEGDVFLLKYSDPVSRVVCVKRMEEIIEREKYTTISVPKKYLFLSHDGKRLVCASKKIIPTQKKEIIIDDKQTTEFLNIALKTGFDDFHEGNFMIDEAGKIVFIDTEARSFIPKNLNNDRSVGNYAFSTHHFLVKDRYNFNRRDRMSGIDFTLTKDARRYLKNKKTEYLHNSDICDSILEKAEYDSTDLNLSKILPLLASKVLPS